MSTSKLTFTLCSCFATVIIFSGCANTANFETPSNNNTSNTQSTTLYIPTVSLSAGGKEIAKKNEKVLNVKTEELHQPTDTDTNPTDNRTLRIDKDENRYYFQENKLVTYILNFSDYSKQNSIQASEKLNAEELEKICRQVYDAYKHNLSHPEKYRLYFSLSDSGSGIAEFNYIYNGIKTNDWVGIYILPNGTISSIHFEDSGFFENLTVPEFNKSDIEAKLENDLASKGISLSDLTIYSEQLDYDKDTQSFSMKYILKDRNGERTDISIPIE